MSTEANIRYLMDRFEIQDQIALYGLGQDLHQPDSGDNDVLAQWSQVFAPDAVIDCTDVGMGTFTLQQYAELMRGPGLKGGGLDGPFKVWQHIEGHATVTITGDTATSIAPHLHMHGTRDDKANTFAVGYWHDTWQRRAEGWRIVNRRVQQLYFHTFPLTPNPSLFDVKFDGMPG